MRVFLNLLLRRDQLGKATYIILHLRLVLFGHLRSQFPLQNQADVIQWKYLEVPGSFDQWFVNGFNFTDLKIGYFWRSATFVAPLLLVPQLMMATRVSRHDASLYLWSCSPLICAHTVEACPGVLGPVCLRLCGKNTQLCFDWRTSKACS